MHFGIGMHYSVGCSIQYSTFFGKAVFFVLGYCFIVFMLQVFWNTKKKPETLMVRYKDLDPLRFF